MSSPASTPSRRGSRRRATPAQTRKSPPRVGSAARPSAPASPLSASGPFPPPLRGVGRGPGPLSPVPGGCHADGERFARGLLVPVGRDFLARQTTLDAHRPPFPGFFSCRLGERARPHSLLSVWPVLGIRLPERSPHPGRPAVRTDGHLFCFACHKLEVRMPGPRPRRDAEARTRPPRESCSHCPPRPQLTCRAPPPRTRCFPARRRCPRQVCLDLSCPVARGRAKLPRGTVRVRA